MRTHLPGLDHREIHKFKNGYGASIVCHEGSYGHERGEFEIAVLHGFNSEGYANVCSSSPITDDVLGFVQPERVDGILEKIQSLPHNKHCDHKRPEDSDCRQADALGR